MFLLSVGEKNICQHININKVNSLASKSALIMLCFLLHIGCYAQTKSCIRCVITPPADIIHCSDSTIEKFLCTFDKDCDWNKKYVSYSPNFNGTYKEFAYYILTMLFDFHLVRCFKITENNPNIDSDYLLSLFIQELETDNYSTIVSIVDQLERMPSKEIVARKFLITLKKSLKDYRLKYEK